MDYDEYMMCGSSVRTCDFEFTSKEIEDQISSYSLKFIDVRDEEVEWKMSVPMFVTSFYRYVSENKKIPTQRDLWIKYEGDNTEWFLEKSLDKEKKRALGARLYRAYPSLVRDIHMLFLLRETKLFKEVLYSISLDVMAGIDLIAFGNKNKYGIRLFVNTPNSDKAMEKKQDRHKNVGYLIYVNIPLSLSTAKKCGEFYVYSDNEIEQMKTTIRRELWLMS